MNGIRKFHPPTGPAFAPGEKWLAFDDSTRPVTIVERRQYGPNKWDVDVIFKDVEGFRHQKDAWFFQIRHYHIADKQS